MIHDPDEPPEYGLVMPFVTVVSKGGPYADAAYAAGWAMGVLDERLSAPWLQQHTDTVLADERSTRHAALSSRTWTAGSRATSTRRGSSYRRSPT